MEFTPYSSYREFQRSMKKQRISQICLFFLLFGITAYQVTYWLFSIQYEKDFNKSERKIGSIWVSAETRILIALSIGSFITHIIMTITFYNTWVAFAKEFSHSEYLDVKVRRARIFSLFVSFGIIMGKFYMLISSPVLRYWKIFQFPVKGVGLIPHCTAWRYLYEIPQFFFI